MWRVRNIPGLPYFFSLYVFFTACVCSFITYGFLQAFWVNYLVVKLKVRLMDYNVVAFLSRNKFSSNRLIGHLSARWAKLGLIHRKKYSWCNKWTHFGLSHLIRHPSKTPFKVSSERVTHNLWLYPTRFEKRVTYAKKVGLRRLGPILFYERFNKRPVSAFPCNCKMREFMIWNKWSYNHLCIKHLFPQLSIVQSNQ